MLCYVRLRLQFLFPSFFSDSYEQEAKSKKEKTAEIKKLNAEIARIKR